MGIVDPEHASPSRIVQRQCVADAVRAMRVGRYASRHELHPEAAANLGQKAGEIEEPVETLVAATHPVNISDNDNYRYDRHLHVQRATKPGQRIGVANLRAADERSRALGHATWNQRLPIAKSVDAPRTYITPSESAGVAISGSFMELVATCA